MAVTSMANSSIRDYNKFNSMRVGRGYATGGTVTTSGGYTIHTFNASGTFGVVGS